MGPPLDLGRFYLVRGRPADALSQFEAAARLDAKAVEPVAGQAQALSRPRAGRPGRRRSSSGPSRRIRAAPTCTASSPPCTSARDGQRRRRRPIGRPSRCSRISSSPPARWPPSTSERNRRQGGRRACWRRRAGPTRARPPPSSTSRPSRSSRATRKAATATYRQALERDPDSPLILNNLAYLLGTDPATRDEAIRLAESGPCSSAGQRLDRRHPGLASLPQGRFATGREAPGPGGRRGAQEPPDAVPPGQGLRQQGRKAEARRELEEALRSGSLPEAKDARAVLDSLK